MALTETVFQRVEKKYRISAATRLQIEAQLRARMAPDSYGESVISSLYFDTPSRGIIARSLEKPLYKEKLRLRVYGAKDAHVLPEVFMGGQSESAAAGEYSSVPVFAEMKKKYKGIVYKRRVKMSPCAVREWFGGADIESAMKKWPLWEVVPGGAGVNFSCERSTRSETQGVALTGEKFGTPSYLLGGAGVPALEAAAAQGGEGAPLHLQMFQVQPSVKDVQISHEIEAMRARWEGIAPAMLIRCVRVAWAPVSGGAPGAVGAAGGAFARKPLIDSDVRITFDTQLTYSEDGRVHVPVIDASESIMEIKCSGAYPDWLVEILNSTKARPSSFSKYGTAARLAWGA